jgi:hypothetical protein
MICKVVEHSTPSLHGCMEVSQQTFVAQGDMLPSATPLEVAIPAVKPSSSLSAAPPRAAVMSMRGAGPVHVASWWIGVRRLDRAFTPRSTHTIILPGGVLELVMLLY